MSHHYDWIDQGDAFFDKQLAQISYPFGTLTQDSWLVESDPNYQYYAENRDRYRAIDNPTREQDMRMNKAFNFGMSQNPRFNASEVAAFGKTSNQTVLDHYANVDKAKATKAAADAQAQADTKTKAISNFDAIGQEDPNKVYSSIATPQPEPSVAFIANNYNTPSLLGNVQAAEGDVPAPQPSGSMLGGVTVAEENVGKLGAVTVAAKAVKEAGNWWNKGKDSPSNLKSLGGPESKAKVFGNKGLLQNDWKQRTFSVDPTDTAKAKQFKAASPKGVTGVKGWNFAKAFTPELVKTGPSPFVRQAVARAFSRVPVLSALMPGTAGLTQAQEMASIGKNPDGSPIAGWQNPFGLSQFMNNNPYNNQKNLFGMRRDRGLEETVTKEGRDYRRGKREERAEEVRAKAQAVADAKAKVEAEAKAAKEAEAEQARQTEKEKQRMVESNSFSDTDSGSFDSGGNYSDWGSQESYDDDFGSDSHW